MYDYIIITHLPSFYKINLYNELAKKIKILVIYIASGSSIRTKDFTDNKMDFDYMYLNKGDFETRNKMISVLKLLLIIKNKNFKNVIVGGWDLPEFWLAVLFTKKQKNCLALESTVFESDLSVLKSLIKKLFLARVAIIFASGSMHKELAEALDFKGKIFITKGVGIINYVPLEIDKKNKVSKKVNKLLYIGRLSREKNLIRLIEALNGLPNINLTIVGTGPQKEELERLAKDNISFLGHIENKKLQEVFYDNDVFVLPSLSETWGLVIDEAIYFGLPILASKRVGSVEELVILPSTGLTFNPYNINDIQDKILEIIELDNYNMFKQNVLYYDIAAKDKEQVSIYIQESDNA